MKFTKHYTETQQKKILNSITVITDTREHEGKNTHILNYFDEQGIPWIKRMIGAGDYSFYIPANQELGIEEDLDFSDEIMVERKKNLEEISSNFVERRKTDKKPGQRIRDEFARAPENKILLIENNSYSDLVEGKYKTELAPKSFWAMLFTMWHQYGIPVVFMPDKKYTGHFIYNYFYYYLRGQLKGAKT